MSIESWNPDAAATASTYTIKPELLLRFIDFSLAANWSTLSTFLSADEIVEHRPIMKKSKSEWFDAVTDLDTQKIELLVRFFTVAEMEINDWDAGADSPVIWLVKALRRQKCPPNKELLLWIKSHSTNRFIPNGAL